MRDSFTLLDCILVSGASHPVTNPAQTKRSVTNSVENSLTNSSSNLVTNFAETKHNSINAKRLPTNSGENSDTNSVTNSTDGKWLVVLDCITWKGYHLFDCAFDFRTLWLRDRLSDISGIGESSRTNALPIRLAPQFACTSAGVASALACIGYELDGVLLYNKQAVYTPGLSPLSLLWKDASNSRLFANTLLTTPALAAQTPASLSHPAKIEASARGGEERRESAIVAKLFVDSNLFVVTGDKPAVCLGQITVTDGRVGKQPGPVAGNEKGMGGGNGNGGGWRIETVRDRVCSFRVSNLRVGGWGGLYEMGERGGEGGGRLGGGVLTGASTASLVLLQPLQEVFLFFAVNGDTHTHALAPPSLTVTNPLPPPFPSSPTIVSVGGVMEQDNLPLVHCLQTHT
jgi:hypothetical protein